MIVIWFLRKEYALHKVLFLLIDWQKLYLERYILVHMAYIYLTKVSFQRLKSQCELKNYVVSFKHIRNLYFDICKRSAARSIFLTLMQGLCEHAFFSSGVVRCLCRQIKQGSNYIFLRLGCFFMLDKFEPFHFRKRVNNIESHNTLF